MQPLNLQALEGIPPEKIRSGGEDAAYAIFRKMRWPDTDGKPVCPQCGHGEAYDIATRRKFKCKACHHQFSVTSGTIFASRKMAFVDLITAIYLLMSGKSALGTSAIMGIEYRTAYLIAKGLRFEMEATQ